MMERIQTINAMKKAVTGSNNPMNMLQMMARNNPQLSKTLEEINKYGNAKDAFYAKAKELNLTDEQIKEVLNLLR